MERAKESGEKLKNIRNENIHSNQAQEKWTEMTVRWPCGLQRMCRECIRKKWEFKQEKTNAVEKQARSVGKDTRKSNGCSLRGGASEQLEPNYA